MGSLLDPGVKIQGHKFSHSWPRGKDRICRKDLELVIGFSHKWLLVHKLLVLPEPWFLHLESTVLKVGIAQCVSFFMIPFS